MMATQFVVDVLAVMAPCLWFVLGLVLIGEAKKRRAGATTCRSCEYNLTGTLGRSPRCPKCGAVLSESNLNRAGTAYIDATVLVFGWVMAATALPLFCMGRFLIMLVFP